MPNQQPIEHTTTIALASFENALDDGSQSNTLTSSVARNAEALLTKSMASAILDLSILPSLDGNSEGSPNIKSLRQTEGGHSIISALSDLDSFVDVLDLEDEINDDFVLVDGDRNQTIAAQSQIAAAKKSTNQMKVETLKPSPTLNSILKSWIKEKPEERTGRRGLAAQIRSFAINPKDPNKLHFNQHKVSSLPKISRQFLPNLKEVDMNKLTLVPKNEKQEFLDRLGIKSK